MKALLIDDDKKLADLLSTYLERFNITLVSALHPSKGLELLRTAKPDIVILDIMLPDQDGFSVCKEIRRESHIPIIMLSARGETTDKIVGLELGADDYLSKPFEPRELVARIQTILRRGSSKPEMKNLKIRELEIKVNEREATLKGESLGLTGNEFELLLYLAQHPGRNIDRDEIMNHLKGLDSDVYSRSVDILISRLRSKLGDDTKSSKFIKTVWGAGYIFIGEGT